ncbi:MAG: tRNA (N6-isopentenyl adenosine(37)-C2)-methylthiotransferase MiaB [Bacillota bacterium]
MEPGRIGGWRLRYHVMTFGCQMNEHDSERLAGMLENLGYQPVDDPAQADVVVLNTCTVRETAETRVFGRLGELKRLKSERPGMIIGVCGCMPQREGAADEVRRRAPHVDLVFGTHNLDEFPTLLRQVAEEGRPVVAVRGEEGEIVEGLPRRPGDDLKAWVTITHGCDNFCSYCIVPYVRGRERSRQPEAIVAEVEGLVAAGCREVTLLGQNVNSYGKDLGEDRTGAGFARLLRMVDGVDGLWRIRFMTSHPRDFGPEVIRAIADCAKVCEHIHLPVQSGSDTILDLMNRGYTVAHYRELAATIRQAIPGVALTTDIIVGFPGETEDDFRQTLDLVREVRFDAAFTFIYSPRSGTPAAGFPEQVPQEVRKERIARLIELQNGITREENQKDAGREVEVLVEGASPKNPGKAEGRTRTNKLVLFPGGQEDRGQLVKVSVQRTGTWVLHGEVVR